MIVDTFGGLMRKPNSVIEVWFNRKKMAKISLDDLVTSKTLFSLYDIQKIALKEQQFEKGIYCKETVIGCIGVYKIAAEEFNINQLTFKLLSSNFTEEWILLDFSYQNQTLQKVKEDCLTKHQEIIFI